MGFFGFDGPFARFTARIFDLVLLHILWVISSIPVFTIGASTTALFTITLKMAKNEEPYIIKGYLKAFKENFVKSTKLWLIAMGVFVWLLLIMGVCIKGKTEFLKLLGIPNAALLIIAFLACLYVFPIQALYENSVKNILKNSVICSLRYLPYSILAAAVVIVPIFITGFVQPLFPFMIMLWLFGGSSLTAFGISYIFNHVFRSVSEET